MDGRARPGADTMQLVGITSFSAVANDDDDRTERPASTDRIDDSPCPREHAPSRGRRARSRRRPRKEAGERADKLLAWLRENVSRIGLRFVREPARRSGSR